MTREFSAYPLWKFGIIKITMIDFREKITVIAETMCKDIIADAHFTYSEFFEELFFIVRRKKFLAKINSRFYS